MKSREATVSTGLAEASHWFALDGMRALAIVAVLIQHLTQWNQDRGWTFLSILHRLELGWVGVHAFFLLSGFLITDILLNCRRRLEARAGTEPSQVVRQFYLRRFLRIFPVYYAALFIVAALNFDGVRHTFFWHLLYATNIYNAVSGSSVWVVGHFWSLAVEEQFYLVWPWLILFTPRRWLGTMIAGSIAFGFGFRVIGYLAGMTQFTLYTSTLACLDSLALGALLAYSRGNDNWQPIMRRIVKFGWIVGPLFFLALTINRLIRGLGPAEFLFYNVAIALTSVSLVDWATRAPHKDHWLASKPLVWVGQLSYGVYVYHMIIIMMMRHAFTRMHISPDNVYISAPIDFALILVVAWASLRLLEQPLNELKRHFPYFPTRTLSATGASTSFSHAPQSIAV